MHHHGLRSATCHPPPPTQRPPHRPRCRDHTRRDHGLGLHPIAASSHSITIGRNRRDQHRPIHESFETIDDADI